MARLRLFRQVETFIDTAPFWAQIAMGILLLAISIVMIYGRINTQFGKKIFSKIPEEEIRTNKLHIIEYTVIPVLATAVYFYLLLT